jgi:hypothetical protein
MHGIGIVSLLLKGIILVYISVIDV